MSHFTARCVLAGHELYLQRAATRLVLPGEQRGPATSDLERAFLVSRGVPPEQIVDLPNRNGTLQQMESVAGLQQHGLLGNVLVVCFAFHAQRVVEYMRMLRIRGDIAEVEQTHVEFLRERSSALRANREELLNLPQLHRVALAEQGISHVLLSIDRRFGRWAPTTRLFKLITGPTITDIERGRARVGLERLELAKALVSVILDAQRSQRRDRPRRAIDEDHAQLHQGGCRRFRGPRRGPS